MLIGRGVDVNSPDNNEKTPLIWACSSSRTCEEDRIRRIQVIKTLLDHGAAADLPDPFGKGPISHALAPSQLKYDDVNPEPDIIHLLLLHKINIYRVDEDGDTPLSLAREYDDRKIMDLFEEYARTHPPEEFPSPSSDDAESSDSEADYSEPQLSTSGQPELERSPPFMTNSAESYSSVSSRFTPFPHTLSQMQPSSSTQVPPLSLLNRPTLDWSTTPTRLPIPSSPSTLTWFTPGSFSPHYFSASGSSTQGTSFIARARSPHASLADDYGRNLISTYNDLELGEAEYPETILGESTVRPRPPRSDIAAYAWYPPPIVLDSPCGLDTGAYAQKRYALFRDRSVF